GPASGAGAHRRRGPPPAAGRAHGLRRPERGSDVRVGRGLRAAPDGASRDALGDRRRALRPLAGARRMIAPTILLCDADGNLFPSEEPAFEASAVVTNRYLERL